MNDGFVENQNRIDEAKFLSLAVAEFPSLANEFAEEDGLFHVQMAAFSHLAQEAIEGGDFATLKRCYKHAEANNSMDARRNSSPFKTCV